MKIRPKKLEKRDEQKNKIEAVKIYENYIPKEKLFSPLKLCADTGQQYCFTDDDDDRSRGKHSNPFFFNVLILLRKRIRGEKKECYLYQS